MKFTALLVVVSAASFIAALPTSTDLPSPFKLHARQTTNIFAADAWENESTHYGEFATRERRPSSEDVKPTTANVQATSSEPLGENTLGRALYDSLTCQTLQANESLHTQLGKKIGTENVPHSTAMDDIFAKSAWAGVPRETGQPALAKDKPDGALTSTNAEATTAPNSGTPPPIFAFDAWEAE